MALVRLVLLGLLLGFAFQGTRALWSPDEGRYVDGALQMLDTGDFMTPAYSSGHPNFSKPPATYWIIAASIKAFGRNAWAARTPYALAFMATLLLLYAIGERLIPERPWLPGLIYGCTTFVFFTANIISTDLFLTVFEALAMLGFLRWAFADKDNGSRRSAMLMWLGFGLAFLTKGPPGLVPLLAIVPFICSRDGWGGLRRLFAPSGIAIFVLAGFLWYAAVALRYPWVVHYFLHQEVYQRLFTGAQRRHPGPFGWIVVYVPTLIVGSLPWWPSLLRSIRSAGHLKNWKTWRRQHSVSFFLALWFLIPFIAFCLAQSRLPLYLLPLFLPLSLIIALDLRERINLTETRQQLLLGAWILLLLASKGAFAYFGHSAADNRSAARQLTAMTNPARYAAVVFIEDTASSYDVEEQTPWGMRLYTGKPIYGIAWHSSDGGLELCEAVRAQRSVLLVVDATIEFKTLQPALANCNLSAPVRLGAWRHSALAMLRI